jgi:hypothetical protein
MLYHTSQEESLQVLDILRGSLSLFWYVCSILALLLNPLQWVKLVDAFLLCIGRSSCASFSYFKGQLITVLVCLQHPSSSPLPSAVD